MPTKHRHSGAGLDEGCVREWKESLWSWLLRIFLNQDWMMRCVLELYSRKCLGTSRMMMMMMMMMIMMMMMMMMMMMWLLTSTLYHSGRNLNAGMFRLSVFCAHEVVRFLQTVEITFHTGIWTCFNFLKPFSSSSTISCLQGDLFCMAHSSVHLFFLYSGKIHIMYGDYLTTTGSLCTESFQHDLFFKDLSMTCYYLTICWI